MDSIMSIVYTVFRVSLRFTLIHTAELSNIEAQTSPLSCYIDEHW